MSSANLEKVLEEVKAMSHDEQRLVQALLETLLADVSPRMTEEEFAQRLLESGILSEVRPPVVDLTPYLDRELIKYEGKPVSEIIIEERR